MKNQTTIFFEKAHNLNLMERQLNTGYAGRIQLRQLVNDLLNNSLATAIQNHSDVVNEVGEGVVLQGMDTQMVNLLNEVIFTVLNNSKRGDIHIRSERYKDHVELRIIDKSNYNGYSLSFSIGAIMPDASRIGSDIMLMNNQQREATVIFSIPGSFAA